MTKCKTLTGLVVKGLSCNAPLSLHAVCVRSASMISAGSVWSRGRNIARRPAATSAVTATRWYAKWKNSRTCSRPR